MFLGQAGVGRGGGWLSRVPAKSYVHRGGGKLFITHTHTHTPCVINRHKARVLLNPFLWYPCFASLICDPAGLLQESLGPEVSPECPRECPRKWGVSEGVSDGVSLGPFGPGLRSVQKVSRECPRSVRDTFLTLRGHSRDTFWTLRRTLPRRPPIFGDTSGPKGPRDSCSRPAGSQSLIPVVFVISVIYANSTYLEAPAILLLRSDLILDPIIFPHFLQARK